MTRVEFYDVEHNDVLFASDDLECVPRVGEDASISCNCSIWDCRVVTVRHFPNRRVGSQQLVQCSVVVGGKTQVTV